MDRIGSIKREVSNEIYDADQVASVVEQCGIHIVDDTDTHFRVLCPFHGNTDTPAMVVDKESGLYNCFTPSCALAGTLVDLVKRSRPELNEFQVRRLIIKSKGEEKPFSERFNKVVNDKFKFPDVSRDILKRMYDNFWEYKEPQDYMFGRNFTEKTLRNFGIGYSLKKNVICVPMHDVNGNPVGFVGRSPSDTDKVFKNSVNLPKARTAFNIHRAKRTGSTVIIVEASFDVMRLHQAGFPNAIALLGGSLTEFHVEQINRYFDTIIIMTDVDARKRRDNCRKCKGDCKGHSPGRDLGRQVVAAFKNKRVLWACYSREEITPGWVKDPGDMTDIQISQCISGSISNYQYSILDLEKFLQVVDS